MKENVSLVIDLYSPELINKSSWIRIVQETVDLLMYENKECGLRHIFIEEAAEFIPQRLQPQHSKVYASLERLARMGRNARLGYTLINQRAEEVNKAILEISAFSLLHKQVGKNSLNPFSNGWSSCR
jgi:DNA helicase HerA-like ATPase